jgi:alpha/beta hydrolase fold
VKIVEKLPKFAFTKSSYIYYFTKKFVILKKSLLTRFPLFFAFGCLSLFSCKKEVVAPPPPFTFTPAPIEGITANFVADVAYDTKALTKFDAFLPISKTPTGMVIFIHGGGFTGGKKEDAYTGKTPAEIKEYLANNIAFVTINYSLLETPETEGVIKCLKDSKRALQYIRSRAADFNIDKTKIVLTGISAGAGTAQWLAFNNDLAEPNSSDPVLKESTRVKAIAVKETQASYDLVRWTDDVFLDYKIPFALLKAQFSALIGQFYGLPNLNDFDSAANLAYRDKVDMLDLLTSDDPEFYVENINELVAPPTTLGILQHHAFHARELKKRATAVKVPHVMYFGNPLIFTDPTAEKVTAFVMRKMKQ